MKPVIYYPNDSNGPSYLCFRCLGCKNSHCIPFINAPPPPPTTTILWCYDGDLEFPTISPSLRVFDIDGKTSACHVVITKGILNYQTDCKHGLAGKSVPMEPWEK